MATTVFRVEKTDNYTIISNYHLQDKKLSNKAKGLLTIMLSLPPNWDMTLRGLVSLSSDGIDAIRATLSELEKNGYLSRSRSRNSQGQLQCTEYTIREEPISAVTVDPEQDYKELLKAEESDNNSAKILDQDGKYEFKALNLKDKELSWGYNPFAFESDTNSEEVSKNTSDINHIGKSDVAQVGKSDVVQVGKSDVAQVGKSDVVQVGKSDVVQIGFSYLGKPYIGKSDPINNLPNKDTYSINNSLSNQYHLNSKNNKDKIDENSKADLLISERKKYEAILKENISYDILTDGEDEEYKDFVDLALNIMLDTVTSTKPLIRIKGQDFPAQTVKSQMLKITDAQIEYIWFCLKESKKRITKMQSYILTALYNSAFGEDLFFAQRVKEDMQANLKNVQ